MATDEYLDILDEQGEKTGEVVEYDETHARGLMHRAAHIWIVNSKGELLLQKRAPNKKQYPNCWDISAAGHISAGQTSKEAAVRETKEEVGLTLEEEDLHLIGTVREDLVLDGGAYANHEFDDVYVVKTNVDAGAIELEDGEVTEVQWVRPEKLKQMIESHDPTLAPHAEEYQMLFNYLQL